MARWAPTSRSSLQAAHRDDSVSSRHRKSSFAAVAILAVCGAGTASVAVVPGPVGGKPTAAPSAATKKTALLTTTTTLPAVPPADLWPPDLFNTIVNDDVAQPPGLRRTWPVLPSSSQFAADIVSDYKLAYGTVGVNTDLATYKASATTHQVPVSVRPGCNNFIPDTGSLIPIPTYAAAGYSTDSPLVIYQPSSGYEWEFWSAVKTSSGWSACWGGRLDMATSDGIFPWPYGLSASGISYLATEITEADVASGSINHAVAMGILDGFCNWPDYPDYVYPADRTDCGSKAGQPAEGQWFRFPPRLAMPSGLTPFAQMVFKAIQDYGVVITDQSGDVTLYAEDPSDWALEGHKGVDPITKSWDGQQAYAVVANLPWGQLQTVQPPST
jgi:hypothetical protein